MLEQAEATDHNCQSSEDNWLYKALYACFEIGSMLAFSPFKQFIFRVNSLFDWHPVGTASRQISDCY